MARERLSPVAVVREAAFLGVVFFAIVLVGFALVVGLGVVALRLRERTRDAIVCRPVSTVRARGMCLFFKTSIQTF